MNKPCHEMHDVGIQKYRNDEQLQVGIRCMSAVHYATDGSSAWNLEWMQRQHGVKAQHAEPEGMLQADRSQ